MKVVKTLYYCCTDSKPKLKSSTNISNSELKTIVQMQLQQTQNLPSTLVTRKISKSEQLPKDIISKLFPKEQEAFFKLSEEERVKFEEDVRDLLAKGKLRGRWMLGAIAPVPQEERPAILDALDEFPQNEAGSVYFWARRFFNKKISGQHRAEIIRAFANKDSREFYKKIWKYDTDQLDGPSLVSFIQSLAT